LRHTASNIMFLGASTVNKLSQWLELVQRLTHVELSTDQDVFIWRLTSSGMFMIESLYLDFMNDHTRFLRKYIWKLIVPLNIKIVMWFRR
jgi:hypothetical protein